MNPEHKDLADLIDLDLVEEIFGHFSALTGLSIRLTDPDGNLLAATDTKITESCPLCTLVQETERGCSRCMRAFARGGSESKRWGEPYFYQCWLGLMEWTVALVIKNELVGVLVCGQVLMRDRDDLFVEEVQRQCESLGLPREKADETIAQVSFITPQQSRAAAEMIQLIAYQISREGGIELEAQRHRVDEQRRIAEAIHMYKDEGSPPIYPIELENKLIGHVRLGEVQRAKEIINNLLGAIFFSDMGRIEVLKARLIELLAVLSRAAVEAGGELTETLGANLHYLQMIIQSERPEDMAGVVVQALEKFTSGVYQGRNTEQLRVLSEALAYTRENITGDLSIEKVARVCHKNSATLRKLFREQLGTTFSDYVNRLRVERSIGLLKDPHRSLAEIAVEVGFYDQSHFGKVFRQITGYTPALYRKKAL